MALSLTDQTKQAYFPVHPTMIAALLPTQQDEDINESIVHLQGLTVNHNYPKTKRVNDLVFQSILNDPSEKGSNAQTIGTDMILTLFKSTLVRHLKMTSSTNGDSLLRLLLRNVASCDSTCS